ncbi:hypothetical protein WMY93_001029 [Mugilogobius chulae]|uniref:XK-related protein n=1 Tax=Mugilogobius chulae TaxID=88201 RepID=A0AAW0Q0N7_9GOBI
MAAKSDGVLKMKKSDVAFTPLHNSEHAGSVQGLHGGADPGPGLGPGLGPTEGDFVNGDSRCCGPRAACLRGSEQRYSLWDALWVLAAVAVYVADVGTDVWLSVDYYLRKDYWWFGLTLFFVVLGSFSVQLFSFRWFVHDFTDSPACAAESAPLDGNKLLSCSASHADIRGPSTPQRQASTASKNTTTGSTGTGNPETRNSEPRSPAYRGCVWFCQAVIHILQLGQVWRYFHTIYLGVRSRQSSDGEHWRFHWRMVSNAQAAGRARYDRRCLLVSLAWALASYQKALRESREDKRPMSYLGVSIQFCWHFFTMAARVITFALFASVFQLYFGLFIVLHWCVMTFWIVHCETDYCVSKWEEIVFDMVVGIIYIFSWFNVKEGRTRFRLFIYYVVILLENAALSTLCATDAFAVPALCVIFSSFLTGLVFMLMYYAFFHPNGPRFGRSPSGQALDLDPTAHFSTLPSEGATNSLKSNRGGGAASTLERDKASERDGCVPPVFQVRPTAPSTPSSRPPRLEETVIKIDLCRNRYPAWERHVLDRSIRKAILAVDCSLTPPRLQYKDDALVQERLEYETTL